MINAIQGHKYYISSLIASILHLQAFEPFGCRMSFKTS